jgi:lipopolysaccharide assembly outer membrane protein LptD (OstA)
MWIRTNTLIFLVFCSAAAFAQNRDSTAAPATTQSGQGQVQFSATDSLVFTLRGGRVARLFGSARILHESGELKAGTVTLDLDQHEMTAESAATNDTLALPVLSREGDELRSRRIRFNYETEKGKFEHARVHVSEGSLIGEQVKRAEPHVVYVREGIYSTCTLDHPHFYIKAVKMKVKDEEEIFFTRAKLHLLDIP